MPVSYIRYATWVGRGPLPIETHESRKAQTPSLAFRTLLTENGAERFEIVRV